MFSSSCRPSDRCGPRAKWRATHSARAVPPRACVLHRRACFFCVCVCVTCRSAWGSKKTMQILLASGLGIVLLYCTIQGTRLYISRYLL